ncbi:unnamed protein product [Cylindrotheca closterium]|uniref:Uncharacterized protein n=1 Tax=Cylindrotheca closterium TaxID=2856 RepID=A0AAD2CQ25_9STRA|nr:unnamed protein product [Cylindrotheca closterium]
MGIFKKKSRSDVSQSENSAPSPSSAASYPAYSGTIYEQQQQQPNNGSPRSIASAPINGSSYKKKKGFGSKLKGLVRSNGKQKSVGDSSKSVGSSASEEPPYDPPQQVRRPVSKGNNDDNDYSSSSSEEFHQELGTVTEVNEDDYDSDGELKPKSKRRISPTPKKKRIRAKAKRLGSGGEDGEFAETITLVILLVDPTTRRFELLQLEQNRPQDLKVKDVLAQVKTCVTEASLKQLQFVGLVDRLCQTHKPNVPLTKAMGFDAKKDILVGWPMGVPVDQLVQSVRPILGDRNMGKLLDMNGFDTKGWVEKKKTKDSILDKPTLIKEEKQGSTLSILAFVLIIAAILVGVDTCLVHLDQKGFFIQPLMDWANVMESTKDLALQGAQAAKEAFNGNNTAAVAMVNTTFAAVEESAMEAVAETKAMVKDFVPVTTTLPSSPKVMFDNAKDMVNMAAVQAKIAEVVSEARASVPAKVAEVVSEARTNVSAGISNVSAGITKTIANASADITNASETISNTATPKAAAAAAVVTTTSPPSNNPVWEDYILIGLLVCWFLYWMAI